MNTDRRCNADALARMESLEKVNIKGCVFPPGTLKLAGKHLAESDFSFMVAEHADYSNTTLYGANMKETRFIGSNFNDIRAGGRFVDYGILQRKKKIQIINWEHVDVTDCSFHRARLEHAYFLYAFADRAQFVDASLNVAIFNNASLNHTNFTGSTLFEADFDHCEMEDAILVNVDATDANFYRAEMPGAHLEYRHV